MKWSWKIGKLAGIEIRIHVTFLVLLVWVIGNYWTLGKGVEAMLAGLAFLLGLFSCVLLHEVGHALAARKYGIATKDITLLPIGGLARLERIPEKPSQELRVALAGPAVNVVIAAVLFLWLNLIEGWMPWNQLHVATGPFWERLLVANLWLAGFNLIPAFPMDGGRVLRALLASRMGYVRATQRAAGVGQTLAVVFGLVGLFGNPVLVFIALFVWIGAAQEATATQLRAAVSGIPIRAAMLTDFRTLQSSDTLAAVVRAILQGSQQDFPVLEQGRVVGILTRSDLLVALAQHGQNDPISAVMRREFLIAEHTEMLDSAIQRLQTYECHTAPVLRDGHLVGLLTMDNLGEYLLIEAAIRDSACTLRGVAEKWVSVQTHRA